ncbi:Bax inhibitor-1/YccA family protein [Nonomuraea ferruginea]
MAIGSAIVALVLGLIASFTMSTNPALILGYAAFQGVFLGAVSSVFDSQINGIVVQAVLATAMAFAGTLAVYTLRIIRVTPQAGQVRRRGGGRGARPDPGQPDRRLLRRGRPGPA